jgi:hypothetical protein
MVKSVFKNYPFNLVSTAKVPIVIKEGEPEWEDAWKNYLAGKPPNDNPAWKEGIYCGAVKEET